MSLDNISLVSLRGKVLAAMPVQIYVT